MSFRRKLGPLVVAITVGGLLALSTGCGPVHRRYVVAFENTRAPQSTDGNSTRALNRKRAAELLNRSDVRVGIYPPDECRDDTVLPSGATAPEGAYLGLDCGVRLAELEAALGVEHYHVVSWQALRDNQPLEAARREHLDLLVEINSLALGERREAELELSGINFFVIDDREEPRPLVLEDPLATGRRCDEVYGRSLRERLDAELGTPEVRRSISMSAKLVAVDDGEVLWLYRRSMSLEPPSVGGAVRLTFRAERKHGDRAKKLRALGILTMSGAGGWYGASGTYAAIEGVDGMLRGGIAGATSLMLAGGALVALGIIDERTAPFKAPEKNLCVGEPVHIEGFGEKREIPQEAPIPGSSYRVNEMRAGTTDPLMNYDRRLLLKLSEDFRFRLSELRAEE